MPEKWRAGKPAGADHPCWDMATEPAEPVAPGFNNIMMILICATQHKFLLGMGASFTLATGAEAARWGVSEVVAQIIDYIKLFPYPTRLVISYADGRRAVPARPWSEVWSLRQIDPGQEP
ncbi:hypothetical protein [Nitrospirillum bahiense]|uniref:hypothetical protein n=1 Tax=Nitrospirillum amazonense TaxID=28077 RepID=UPI0011A86F8C|nr:hypothetical protein [Nitrospirillum amazonense]